MILTTARKILKLDRLGFTAQEAFWADLVWMICVGVYFLVVK